MAVQQVEIHTHDQVVLKGRIWQASAPKAWLVFAHGSGSSYESPRNNKVAEELAEQGYSSLLFDLLSHEEAYDRRLVFHLPLLSKRLLGAVEWLNENFRNHDVDLFLYGASTGAAAALVAVSEHNIGATGIISRGGRPDLAGDYLNQVEVPVLLLVGEDDSDVFEFNKEAQSHLTQSELKIVKGAGHLFEEPGALEQVMTLTREFMDQHHSFRKNAQDHGFELRP